MSTIYTYTDSPNKNDPSYVETPRCMSIQAFLNKVNLALPAEVPELCVWPCHVFVLFFLCFIGYSQLFFSYFQITFKWLTNDSCFFGDVKNDERLMTKPMVFRSVPWHVASAAKPQASRICHVRSSSYLIFTYFGYRKPLVLRGFKF